MHYMLQCFIRQVFFQKMFASGTSGILQKLDPVGGTFRCNRFRPQRALHFADVGLAQEEHADAGLADAAADCIRKLSV